MSADTSDLSKVDSAVGGVDDASPPKGADAGKRRLTSSAPGVMKLAELEKEGVKIQISPETQRLGWKINSSPNSVDDPTVLKKFLTTPPINKVDLHFPLGLEVTARNMKGVTIKDALDAIHKQFKKKQDDELDEPYLKGFEYDTDESWTRLKVHQSKNPTSGGGGGGGGKKKKNKADTVEE